MALFKWKVKVRKYPELRSLRVKRKLLLFPKCLKNRDGVREWRWFGFERIVQKYCTWEEYVPEGGMVDVIGWRNIKWDK